MKMNYLARELIGVILDFSDLETIRNLSLVNKALNKIIKNSSVWLKFIPKNSEFSQLINEHLNINHGLVNLLKSGLIYQKKNIPHVPDCYYLYLAYLNFWKSWINIGVFIQNPDYFVKNSKNKILFNLLKFPGFEPELKMFYFDLSENRFFLNIRNNIKDKKNYYGYLISGIFSSGNYNGLNCLIINHTVPCNDFWIEYLNDDMEIEDFRSGNLFGYNYVFLEEDYKKYLTELEKILKLRYPEYYSIHLEEVILKLFNCLNQQPIINPVIDSYYNLFSNCNPYLEITH